VPHASFLDYFRLFSDPKDDDLERYFQGGRIAAYEHTAMIKLHYSIADALDECVARLEKGTRGHTSIRRRSTLSSMERQLPFMIDGGTSHPINTKGSLAVNTLSQIQADDGAYSSSATAPDSLEDEYNEAWVDM